MNFGFKVASVTFFLSILDSILTFVLSQEYGLHLESNLTHVSWIRGGASIFWVFGNAFVVGVSAFLVSYSSSRISKSLGRTTGFLFSSFFLATVISNLVALILGEIYYTNIFVFFPIVTLSVLSAVCLVFDRSQAYYAVCSYIFSLASVCIFSQLIWITNLQYFVLPMIISFPVLFLSYVKRPYMTPRS